VFAYPAPIAVDVVPILVVVLRDHAQFGSLVLVPAVLL
jgi:hypothetical protein